MAETYNPVARSLVGRNHFLTKPNRETDLSRAMQNFEEKLSQLNAAKEKPGPSP
jgi:YesN/AraC family two-component response regulator